MPHAPNCHSSFDILDRIQGQAYHQTNSVKLAALHDSEATAIVRGPSGACTVRVVAVEYQTDMLVATCTCPRYEEYVLCDHIWATLLQLTDQGWLDGFDPDFEILHSLDFDEEDDLLDDGDEDEDEFNDVEFSQLIRRTPPLPLAGPTNGSSWKQQMLSVRRAADQLTAPREPARRGFRRGKRLWYLLDVTESVSRRKLVIRLAQQERKRDGEFGKARKQRIRSYDLDQLENDDERLLAEMLIHMDTVDTRRQSPYGVSDPRGQGHNSLNIAPEMQELVVPKLCSTGRLVWLLDTANLPIEEAQPLAWDNGQPWRFRLHVQDDQKLQKYSIRGLLERDGERVELEKAVLICRGLVVFPGTVGRVEVGDKAAWLATLQKAESIEVPYADRGDFVTQLYSMPQLPTEELPESLLLREEKVEPQPRLEIKTPAQGLNSRELDARVCFLYGEMHVSPGFGHAPGLGQRQIIDHENRRIIPRDAIREQSLLDRAVEAGLVQHTFYNSDSFHLTIPIRSLPEVVRSLIEENWIVESDGRPIRRPGSFSLSVKSGVDWFELDGQLDFDGQSASLPELLAAVRNNERFVRLGDGTHGMLPEEWLERYAPLAGLGEADGDSVKFRPSQALLLDALLASQEDVNVDAKFRAYRRKLHSFEGVKPASEPKGFDGQLRDYQKEGLGWLHFLRNFQLGGCLADDMGLGKTIQVLALLESRRRRRIAAGETRAPSLAVVPKSLIFNWIEEAARFTPKLRVLNYTGINRVESFDELDQHDLIVTTYGTLRRDILQLKDIRFDYAILDEAQAIKNANAQSAKAVRLIDAEHRLAMTGTPVENHLGELWSLFEFLNPGMLGQSKAFRAFSSGTGGSQDGDTLQMLAKSLRPFLLRRTKEQVLSELPEKSEQTLYCELSTKERKQYDELREYYRASLAQHVKAKGIKRSKIHVLEALLRLRQASCHLGLLDKKKEKETSAKLEVLLEQLDEILDEGHKALVFSQFTSLLAIVRRHLDKKKITYEYLDGRTSKRGEKVKRFQDDPDCPLFLISLKAGGHGLNLTAADYVFILDPWWNPAVEAQAIDRVHRIGQSRRVFAYRIIARDTVEDKILAIAGEQARTGRSHRLGRQ